MVTPALRSSRRAGSQPYNGAALASQAPPEPGTIICRSCGKSIEAEARFCRFCGKAQSGRSATAAGPAGSSSGSAGSPRSPGRSGPGVGPTLEERLQQLFPRHQVQDEFMHVGGIVAFFLAAIGFVLGFFTPALGGSWLSVNFLLGAIALLLFLILREWTLSLLRSRGTGSSGRADAGGRPQSGRQTTLEPPPEAATSESSP